MEHPSQPSEVVAQVAPADTLKPRKLFVSFSQNFEDVLLHRVFAGIDRGFYVDIGAFDPVLGSVTKAFYDRGWSGINIEPGPLFERLLESRPRDTNLNIAILDQNGEVDFFEDTSDLGASHVEAAADAGGGRDLRRRVRCELLDDVLAEHAAERRINFLKIDAEGSEARIIRSTDWRKYRPQVLVVEAVAPWTNNLISGAWEPTLLSAGYRRAYFDGLNLFFVAEEHSDLLKHFDRPVNELDWFTKYEAAKNRELTNELKELNWHFEKRFFEIYRRLERVPRKHRGLPEEDEPGSAPEMPLPPKPEKVISELDAALSSLLVYDRMTAQLRQAVGKRKSLSEPPRPVGDPEDSVPLEPEELLRELEAAIAAAIRCDRIVLNLDGAVAPRSLRVVLPLAKLIRTTGGVLRRKHQPRGTAPPGTRLAKAGAGFGSFIRKIPRPISWASRRVFLPLALRTREFMLAPLFSTVGKVDVISRDIEAIRHALHAAQAAGQLSPQLVQNLEALLLTLAVRPPRG